jgi:hypothetical protein
MLTTTLLISTFTLVVMVAATVLRPIRVSDPFQI